MAVSGTRVGFDGGARSGFVVSDAMAMVLVLLAVGGVVADRPLAAALGAVVLMLVLAARVWTRVALTGVDYALCIAPERAVEGDTVTLTLTLANAKPLPVAWLRVREHVPAGLELTHVQDTARGAFGATLLVATTGLGPRERVRLTYRLRATRRGHYVIGPGRVGSGDPFGFYEAERVVVRATGSLVVYPRIPALPCPLPPLARPLGDAAARRRTLDDPTRPVTVREHRAGDAARQVDWKVTARRGVPWVRVNEASVAGAVVLLLECDMRTRGVWDEAPELLEASVRIAAALARDLLARGHAVGLVANGVPPGDRSRVAVAPAAGPAQLAVILDALARVQSIVVKTLPELAAEHAGRVLPFGATVVCIAAVLREETARLLAARARRGARALLVRVSEGDEEDVVPGVSVVWMPAEAVAVAGESREAGV